jgi:TolB-like protein
VLLALALGLTSAARFLPWNSGDHVRRTADEAEPAVLVMPLEASGDEGSQLLASGLTGELIATLMRFDALRVFAGVPPDEGSSELPPAASGARAYIVSGRVVREPGRLRVTARLTDRASEQVLWSRSYDRALTTDDILDIEAELAAGIVSQLAQDYGVITEAATKGLGEGRPESLTAYDCVQRAVAYRRTFVKELYPPVRSCLEDVVRHDPGYADAWAMLAIAHLDAARYGFVEPAARAGEMAAGVEAALHAVALAPNRVRPWQSLAALRFMSGDYDEAERVARHAIALNPNNPESLAQLGWRLMARGRWDEGAQHLQDAIDRSVRVPVWYYSCLASALYLKGDYTRALNAAELGKGDCCGIGHAVLAIAQAAAGRPEKARAALDEAIRQAPVLGRDPRAFWANYQRSDEAIDRLNAGLAQAGLEAARRGTPAPASPGSTPQR